ncbi:MAG: cytochrome C [Betaproteobacteria bacterium]|nr:MAG: cytochrome C [Betaproteobacteria bacterium]
MPQIFRRSANTLSKVSIFGLLSLVGGLILLAIVLARSSYVTRQHIFVEQPLQFSHMHHVTDDGIDCRYCHTSAETSSFAGIPPTKTCMNCHSVLFANASFLEPVRASFRDNRPLHWVRVHDLPDFVYFNHSIHIKKGIGCETCHGRIDQMPLTYQQNSLLMEWCIDCHKNPAPNLRPREEITTMGYRPAKDQAELGPELMKAYNVNPSTSCSTCHR